MIKMVRVILSARVQDFNRGIKGASRTFSGFVKSLEGGVANAVASLNGLARGLFFLREGLDTIMSAAMGLFNMFLGGAIEMERMGIALEVITGDAAQAADMIAFLREEATRTGQDFDGLAQSGQQLAVALRGATGEVDSDVWESLVKQVEAFQALRPDVPVSLWGRAISAFLAGDASTLTRLLDVNIKQLGNLSEEAQAFLQGASAASEQQLGQVTRLSGGVEANAGDALSALAEVANAVGATDELVDRIADTTGGKLAQAQAELKDTLTEIGLELLPSLNVALDKLLEFLRSEEFEKLAKAFGEFGAEGLEELVELIEGIDPEQVKATFEGMADELNSVDWEAIGNAVLGILDLMGRFANWQETDEALAGQSNIIAEALPTFLEGKTGELFDEGGLLHVPDSAADSAFGSVADSVSEAIGGVESNGNTITVLVGVDEDANLNIKSVAIDAAIESIGNLITGLLKD